jgi:hypothetical protein
MSKKTGIERKQRRDEQGCDLAAHLPNLVGDDDTKSIAAFSAR